MDLVMNIFLGILGVSCFMCLLRIARGPTPPDRTVAIDILGILIVSFCALMAVITGQDFYISIALVWALLSFIGTIALAKYLQGRGFDE